MDDWQKTVLELTEGAIRDVCPAGPAPTPYVEDWKCSMSVMFVVANKDVARMHNAIVQEQDSFDGFVFDRLGAPMIIPFGDDRAAFLLGGDMGVGSGSWPDILSELLMWAVNLEGIELEIRWPIGCDGSTRG